MTMTAPDYRERLKTTILMVARDVLVNEGLGALQARRIAREADCSVGTIYNLYGNLDLVALSANAMTLSDLKDDLAKALQTADDTLAARLDALASAYLSFAINKQHAWRAVFEHRLASETTKVPDWYRDAQEELFALVQQALTKTIDDVPQRREAARALLSAVHGVVSIALDQKRGDFDAAATASQVKFVARTLARGLAA